MFAPPPLPRTLEASLRDLGSHRPSTRAEAIHDLARHAGASDALRATALPKIEALLEDPEAPVRAAAATALGELVAVGALPKLLVAVEDANALVRQMALESLGEIGDPRAAARLERALSDGRPDVRYQALIAYARVLRDRPDDVARALASALADADDAIRYIALRIAEEWLDEGRPLPREAIEPTALRLLADAKVSVAIAAAILLTKLGRDEGRGVVLEVVRDRALRGHRVEHEDESAAVELAGRMGLREAIPALEKRAWGALRLVKDTCAWHARVALAALDHPRALAEIERDLESVDREAVQAAVVAIGRARITALGPRVARLTQSAADPALVAEALARLAEQGNAR